MSTLKELFRIIFGGITMLFFLAIYIPIASTELILKRLISFLKGGKS